MTKNSALTPSLHHVEGVPRLAFDMLGEGPPVIFLHGIGGGRHSWRNQLLEFGSRFTAIAWDARGYGASDDYDGPLAFSAFGDDLVRLLNKIGAERAHLVGLSMGARILMDFYPRYRERAATLTLCDCFFSFEAALSPAKQEEFIALRQKPLLEGATFADLAPALIRSLVSADCSAEVRETLRRSILGLRKDSYLKTIAATVRYDRSAELSSFDVPVQLIFGEADALTPPLIGETMLQMMPNATLEILPGAGHLSNLEAPEAFNAALGAFLDRHADDASFGARGG